MISLVTRNKDKKKGRRKTHYDLYSDGEIENGYIGFWHRNYYDFWSVRKSWFHDVDLLFSTSETESEDDFEDFTNIDVDNRFTYLEVSLVFI